MEFRSRLEARWAAFFDALGWIWEYEPIDLDGYIPDFVLQFSQPVLVEVKPIVRWPCLCCSMRWRHDDQCFVDDMVVDAIDKIRNSGWSGVSLLVGAVRCESFNDVCDETGPRGLGWLIETDEIRDLLSNGWQYVVDAAKCGACAASIPNLGMGDIPCPACGATSTRNRKPITTDALWREAGNRVQWRGRGAHP